MEAIDWFWNHREELLVAVGAIGVAAEGGALALLSLARILEGLAKLTGTDADDRALARIVRALEAFVSWIPRLRTKARPPEDAIGPMLVVLLCIAPLIGGCGGSGVEVARHAAAGGALAVVSADPILAAEYDRAIEELEAGTLTEEAFTARLQKLDRAERALRSLSSSLTAVDLALGAYEDGRECGLRSALVGAEAAAREVIEALDAAGVDVPPLVMQVLGLAALVIDAPVCEPDAVAVAP